MKNVPSLVGVVVLFAIVYFLTEAALTTTQLICGIAAAVLVYGATMAWHIRNLLREP
jgi:ABC-type amino acid transport system permease subunit